jgi:hypothetical protein
MKRFVNIFDEDRESSSGGWLIGRSVSRWLKPDAMKRSVNFFNEYHESSLEG